MSCDRIELPGGNVAIVCGLRQRTAKPKSSTCTRCREHFTPAKFAMRTLCPDCIADLS